MRSGDSQKNSYLYRLLQYGFSPISNPGWVVHRLRSRHFHYISENCKIPVSHRRQFRLRYHLHHNSHVIYQMTGKAEHFLRNFLVQKSIRQKLPGKIPNGCHLIKMNIHPDGRQQKVNNGLYSRNSDVRNKKEYDNRYVLNQWNVSLLHYLSMIDRQNHPLELLNRMH